MTREEFDNDVCDWYELLDFCREFSLETCDDIYDMDGVVEIVRDIIFANRSYDALLGIQDLLREGCIGGSDYYKYDDGTVYDADPYFDEYKDMAARDFEELYKWDCDDEAWYDDEFVQSDFDVRTFERIVANGGAEA